MELKDVLEEQVVGYLKFLEKEIGIGLPMGDLVATFNMQVEPTLAQLHQKVQEAYNKHLAKDLRNLGKNYEPYRR